MHAKKFLYFTGILIIIAAGIYAFYIIRNLNEATADRKINDDIYYKQLDEDMIAYESEIGTFVSNELILMTDGADNAEIEDIISGEGGTIVGYIDTTNTYQIEFDDDIQASALTMKKETFEKNESVDFVSYNYVLCLDETADYYPDDKEWLDMWDDNMQTGNWGLKALNVPQAWNYIQNNYDDLEEIQIGVLEGGRLSATHEDLKDNLGYVWGRLDDTDNLINNFWKFLQKEAESHGTMVTGILGAVYNNGLGISGVLMNNAVINYYSYDEAKDSGKTSIMSLITGMVSLITSSGKDQTAIINVSLGYALFQTASTHGIETAKSELSALNNAMSIYLQALLSEGYDFLIIKAAGNETNKDYLRVDVDESDSNTIYEYVVYEPKNEEYKYLEYLYEQYEGEEERIVSGEIDASYDILSGITDEEVSDRILVVGGLANPENNEYPLF